VDQLDAAVALVTYEGRQEMKEKVSDGRNRETGGYEDKPSFRKTEMKVHRSIVHN
jgi:hypothetical protein